MNAGLSWKASGQLHPPIQLSPARVALPNQGDDRP